MQYLTLCMSKDNGPSRECEDNADSKAKGKRDWVPVCSFAARLECNSKLAF